jgi:hypothetical protein
VTPFIRRYGKNGSLVSFEELLQPYQQRSLNLFQILSEAERAEDIGCDSEDEEGEDLRPEDGDSVSFQ